MTTSINWLVKILIALFAAAMIVLVWKHNADKPRIFIVHSYNTDLSWVKSIDEGLDLQLRDSHPSAQVRRHYMDLKNHNGCNFRRRSAHDVLFAIKEWQPDYLLLVDDLAQQLVGAHYLDYSSNRYPEESLAQELFRRDCPDQDANFYQETYVTDPSQLPDIIFAGVNYSVAPYGYFDAVNVQGIYEHKNFKALADTLEDLQESCGGAEAIAIQPLNDFSQTARRESDNYKSFDWAPLSSLEPVTASSFQQWKDTVEHANENGAMILVANYQQVPEEEGSERNVSAQTIVAWTEKNARFPVLGAGTDYVTDGGMITVAIAGLEQGKTLARLVQFPPVRKRLVDENVLRAEQFLVGLAARKIKQRCGDQLPSIYSAYAKETGLYLFEDVSETLYVER